MPNKPLLTICIAVVTAMSLSWTEPALAGLPPGNAVKDPSAILRSALPVDQKDLRDLEQKLDGTSELLRGKRWSALDDVTASSQFLINTKSSRVISDLPEINKEKGEVLIKSLKQSLQKLGEDSNNQNKEE